MRAFVRASCVFTRWNEGRGGGMQALSLPIFFFPSSSGFPSAPYVTACACVASSPLAGSRAPFPSTPSLPPSPSSASRKRALPPAIARSLIRSQLSCLAAGGLSAVLSSRMADRNRIPFRKCNFHLGEKMWLLYVSRTSIEHAVVIIIAWCV